MPRKNKRKPVRLNAHKNSSSAGDIAKSRRIHDALVDNPPRIEELRRCCIVGGLMTPSNRQRVWPVMLGLTGELPDHAAIEPQHECLNQVDLDVNRSFWRFPKGIRSTYRLELRRRITLIINAIFTMNPELNYYQGFHEICSVLMLNTNDTIAFGLASILGSAHINDALAPNLTQSMAHCEVIFAVLQVVDQELYDVIMSSDSQPHFAIGWILTWFAHDIEDFELISRIYDACIASHPLFPAYLAAALIEQAKPMLTEVECEFSEMYKALRDIPQSADFERAIHRADELISSVYPPEQAIKSMAINEASQELLQLSESIKRYKMFSKAVLSQQSFQLSPFHDGDSPGSAVKAVYSRILFVVAGSATAAAVIGLGLFLENLDAIVM